MVLVLGNLFDLMICVLLCWLRFVDIVNSTFVWVVCVLILLCVRCCF